MSGGGDTPSTKTLWSLKGEEAVIFGQFQDGKVLIEGPVEDKMYVADINGVVKSFGDYNPAIDYKKIFAQYFGEIKSVQILATGHEINYVVPNWAEYKLLN